ncbi:efflux RND transporter periplasmic adaptor subunit [Patescibacteria group bacterium]|nr:efflux RND transporter periplasmic adaptor subunit [Patescibacteria group bacterium]MBU4481637.1 efflux RND transporter periplasmic adaptor subunit [Patescibacteria group bacterium]
MISKLFTQLIKRKFTAGILFLVIAGGGYFGYTKIFSDDGVVRYATAQVQNGTLIVSISGNGQVSASNQVDIKSKVKSEVVAVYVEKGEEVKTGKLIVNLDVQDYQKAVKDAETSLETAKLELEELLNPPDELTLLKAENTVLQAKNSLEKLKLNQETEYQRALETIQEAENDIKKSYEDTLNTITDAFWDLQTVITGVRDILYSYEIAKSEIIVSDYSWNISALINSVDNNDRYQLEKFINSAESDYNLAREKYDPNFENYSNTSLYSEKKVVEDLLNETIETTKSIAQAIKSEVNLLGFIVDYFSNHNRRIYSKITEYQSNLKSYSSKTNSILSSLLSIQRSLQDSRDAKLSAEQSLVEMEKTHPLDLTAAEITLEEKEKSLAEIIAGPDELEIRAKKITIQQREDALTTAKQALADCHIYIPFDGIITEVKIKKGDSVSAGTALANIITQQKIAEISLNEVDVAKVKASQKVTLTFDAVPDLTLTGQVVEVDAAGAVSQGVVTYAVKIAFDTQDERVKIAMSVSAAIVTEAKPNVLLVPNSAVKSLARQSFAGQNLGGQGGMSYVEIVEGENSPRRQPVEVGTASDEFTEIISGLKEGDVIVTRTIQPTAAQSTQTQQNSSIRIPGINTGGTGGGGMRR